MSGRTPAPCSLEQALLDRRKPEGVMLIVINPFLVVGVTWHARELARVAARSMRADNDWEEARKDGPRAG